jgi:hypothetical protein
MARILFTAAFTVTLGVLADGNFAAEPRVSLEIATEPGFVPTEARAWSEMLSQAGFANVRIRGGRADDRPGIETRGTDAAPSYYVLGVLTSDNKLALPKARFGLADRAKIEQWLANVRASGVEGIAVKPAAFGLLPRQLVAVHEALAVPVGFSTKDKQPREVARQIADGLSLKFISDPAGQQALAAQEPVLDELQGFSSGTALAVILRPLGLALLPERSGADVRLRIADIGRAPEHWPVGWPPKGNPKETLPDLFKFLNVEIVQTPIAEALTAIAGRLNVPLLIDHVSLARQQADLSAKVDLPRTNIYYAGALDRLLFQAKLKYELRVDEANKVFLWVTTLRQ